MGIVGRILSPLSAPGEEPRPGLIWLRGGGRFGLSAVGESNYQPALEEIAGGKTPRGVDKIVDAELVLEDDNPHDPQAVAVLVQRRKVGYLSRADARRFRGELEPHYRTGMKIRCKARIRGGWDRGGGDSGHFGVWLDAGDG